MFYTIFTINVARGRFNINSSSEMYQSSAILCQMVYFTVTFHRNVRFYWTDRHIFERA